MRELQASQRAKASAAVNPRRGLVLVHTGSGKGSFPEQLEGHTTGQRFTWDTQVGRRTPPPRDRDASWSVR